jgi:hypothetical protein
MPTQGTYWIDTSSFATTNNLYTDSGLTTVASDGWYKSGDSFRQLLGGNLGASIYTCECTAFSSSTVQSTSAAACTATQNQTYYHTGSGSTPIATNVCYSDPGQTVLPNGNYKISSTQYIQITGGSGVVASVGTFSLGVSFNASSSQTNATNACVASINQTFYHNGTVGQLPVATNTCYTNECKTVFLGNGFYKIGTVADNKYIQITGGSGVVASVTTCPSALEEYDSSQTAVTSPNACFQSLGTTYYYDGTAGGNPAVNDTCYTTSAGTTTLPSGWYRANNVGGDVKYNVNSSGVVQSVIACE